MASEGIKTIEVVEEISKEIESIEKDLVKLVIHVDKQDNKIEIYENNELLCELKLDEDRKLENNFDNVIVEYIQYETVDLYEHKILEILEDEAYISAIDVYTKHNYAIIDFFTSLKRENIELEKENYKIVVKDSNADFADSILRLELLLYEHKEFANFEEYVFRVHKDIVEKLKEQIETYNEIKKDIKQLFEKESKRVLRENKEATVSYTESWDIYTKYYTHELENVAVTFSYSSQLNEYKVKLYENKKVVYVSELHEVFVESLEEYTAELLEDFEGKLYDKAIETAEKVREEVKKELKEKYGIEAWESDDWEEWKELALETKVEYEGGEVENEAIAVITFAREYEHKSTLMHYKSTTYYIDESEIGVYVDEELIKELTSN